MKVTLRKSVESKIRANARRGARALDKINKDWYKQQNLALSRLDLESSCDCVWGQLSKGFGAENEAFQAAYNNHYGTATPGYLPAYNPNDDSGSYVSPEAQRDYATWESDDAAELRYAVQDKEFKTLQDEWEKQIRIRRQMHGAR